MRARRVSGDRNEAVNVQAQAGGGTDKGRKTDYKEKSKRIERGWRERGGHVSSAEPTSCPDPKMERLQERHHSPLLIPHTLTETD